MNVNKTFLYWAIATVISVLAFFHIDSYFADSNNLNWLMWVIALGAGAVSVYFLLQLLGSNRKKD